MRTRTHPFLGHIYHRCVYTEAPGSSTHVDVRRLQQNLKQTAAGQRVLRRTHDVKGLFTNSSPTSMTHKQSPFSSMKGDLLRWHRTSRCITKPHPLIIVSLSFSYTGKHLLIYVTITLYLEVLTCHRWGANEHSLQTVLPENHCALEHDRAAQCSHRPVLTCWEPVRPRCQKLS